MAADGIEQGDPAGPAQFACGIKELLDAMDLRLQVAAQARGLPVPYLFAYLDDTIIGVEPQLLAEAFDIAAAATGRTLPAAHRKLRLVACQSMPTRV